MFLFILITCLLDVVLIWLYGYMVIWLYGYMVIWLAEILSWSLMGVNPLTPKISLVILLTVCQMIFIMLVWRI